MNATLDDMERLVKGFGGEALKRDDLLDLIKIARAVARMADPAHPAYSTCPFCGKRPFVTVGDDDRLVHADDCAWLLAREMAEPAQ